MSEEVSGGIPEFMGGNFEKKYLEESLTEFRGESIVDFLKEHHEWIEEFAEENLEDFRKKTLEIFRVKK